ncbi:MAG TPA: Gfo/Idh/MocA family oxidoreductase [Fimbriiglobus sp.]|jgi:predicted dehydrogenase
MALDLTEEQRIAGRRNFEEATGELTRRGFMKSMVAAGAVVPLTAAVYFGYDSWRGNKAVRTALVGCGDEGGVLVGDHNPEFNEIVAVCDIRPYNMKRIFAGDTGPRKGLNKVYGKSTAEKIAKYDDYKKLIDDSKNLGIEAVIIATPLVLHAPMAIDFMNAGIHVFSEKLMARTIPLCKDMIKTAKEKKTLIGVGHQRHYSMLYAHALEVVQSGVLGDLKHIKAQWPRNNSWPYDVTTEKEKVAKGYKLPELHDSWFKAIYQVDADALKDPEVLKRHGFTSMEELIRWRCYNRTGGGLMAELGSHQLDAASIFLGDVRPLSVQGVGGKFFFGPGKNDRESDDCVFVNYEFPGKNHPKGPNGGGKDESDIVVVSYTSFNTNSFEQYGECLMGSRGTMLVEMERDVFLYKEKEPGPSKVKTKPKETAVKVTAEKAGEASMAASSTWGGGGAAVSKESSAPAWDTPVRGYRSELEHFAYCVRRWDKSIGWEKKDGKFVQEVPLCHGEVAMADAILALTANFAMKTKQRIEFESNWFDADKSDSPEGKYDKTA